MVHVVDVASKTIKKNIVVGKRPRRFAITPNGQELWVTNELGASVSVISLKDYSVISTIALQLKGARSSDITPIGLVMTRDGKRAYVTMGRANHVAFIDVASRQITDQVLVGKRPWSVALSADESKLYVVNGLSDDMTVVDTARAKALISVPVGRVPHTVVLTN
jgi:YVTN family beta-propeller protein